MPVPSRRARDKVPAGIDAGPAGSNGEHDHVHLPAAFPPTIEPTARSIPYRGSPAGSCAVTATPPSNSFCEESSFGRTRAISELSESPVRTLSGGTSKISNLNVQSRFNHPLQGGRAFSLQLVDAEAKPCLLDTFGAGGVKGPVTGAKGVGITCILYLGPRRWGLTPSTLLFPNIAGATAR